MAVAVRIPTQLRTLTGGALGGGGDSGLAGKLTYKLLCVLRAPDAWAEHERLHTLAARQTTSGMCFGEG